MQLILAIDSDRRQAEQLASLVRSRLTADLVQATSAGEGLHALQDRVPDLILTSPLLSPFDDGVLDEYLRDLGAAAMHVQTLRIPVLSAATKKKASAKSLFSLGRKKRTASSAPDGCDPTLFADEIALYLTRAAEERLASLVRVAPDQHAADSNERIATAIAPTVDEPSFIEEPAYVPEPIAYAPEQVFETYTSERTTYAADAVAYAEPSPEPVMIEERLVADVQRQADMPLVIEEPAAIEEPFEPVLEAATETVYASEPVYATEPVYAVEPVYADESVYATEPVYANEPVYAEPIEAIEVAEALPIALMAEPDPIVAVIEAAPVAIEPLTVEALVNAPDPEPEPEAAPAPLVAAAPAPAAKLKGAITSFEAALAAIRAAWTKPEPDVPVVPQPASQSAAPAAESAEMADLHGAPVHHDPVAAQTPVVAAGPATRAPGAAQVEVDLTGEIDALEPVPGGEVNTPGVVEDEPATGEPNPAAPAARRRQDKSKKRPEKVRGRKLRTADGRPVQDEWGIFDPNQCGFSALVNKLDEVTEPDEAPPRVGTTVRVISFG